MGKHVALNPRWAQKKDMCNILLLIESYCTDLVAANSRHWSTDVHKQINKEEMAWLFFLITRLYQINFSIRQAKLSAILFLLQKVSEA